MFRSENIQVFKPSHDSPNLRRHDEYYYMRQAAFLNVFFKLQVIKSPNLAN